MTAQLVSSSTDTKEMKKMKEKKTKQKKLWGSAVQAGLNQSRHTLLKNSFITIE